MKKLFSVVLLTLCTAGLVFGAEPECEVQADTEWMEQGAFQDKVEGMGYTIIDMSVTEGNCYQVSAQNKDGQDVNAYFNPQTGDVVQEVVAQ